MYRSGLVMLFASICVVTLAAMGFASDKGIWLRIDPGAVRQMAPNADQNLPKAFSAFTLNEPRLAAILDETKQQDGTTAEDGSVVELPMPDGSLARFRIEHSLVVEEGLLEKYPELGATFRGYGIDDPTATVRLDLLPSGFHAFILSSGGASLIDPQESSEGRIYTSYLKDDSAGDSTFECEVGRSDFRSITTVKKARLQDIIAPEEADVSSGTQLRTYRLALAANWEYCNAVSGGSNTIANCLAAEVLIMNRVNAVYEKDLAIHMNIVANNNLVVYAADQICAGVPCTSANDPYGNGTGALNQNTPNLNAVIGAANYDIGHVFTTGSGGVALLGVPCGSSKGGGTTGLPNPVGDGFAIDFVAHEMGHQFGANHTFNTSCGGNRSNLAAYEPGSGITIMGYAGVCGAQDLALHSIDTFHVKSIEEIVAYTTTGNGNTCAVTTPTGNAVPSGITVGGPYNIPQQTPFALTASAIDANGDPLTYDWQEYDIGAASSAIPNTDGDGTARAIFKPYLPTTSGTRTFPALPYILNNANVPPATYDCGRGATQCLTGELLPSLTRAMNFQVIVRDNRSSGGGVNTATARVNVTTLSGPFLVTSPNTAVAYNGNSQQTITWQVADTNLAPVLAANVDILLSTDGGLTFPTVLAAATPNDGSQTVTLPNVNTSTARIKVQATGNIFFDISNANFTINAVSSTVSISGRVLTADGRGVKNAHVVLTDTNGGTVTISTGQKGFFTFSNVMSGRTYTISVQSRRFQYTPQTIPVSDNVTGLIFQPI